MEIRQAFPNEIGAIMTVQVLSMRNKANRLEELFVSLVNEKQGDRA